MATPVSLADIITELEAADDGATSYFDRDGGRVVLVTDEARDVAESDALDAGVPRWQRESIALARLVLDDDGTRFVRLPGKRDIHEWQMMADFASSLADDDAAARLSRALHGRGAFRVFKDTAASLGLVDAWFSYRDERFRQLAIERCTSTGLEWHDDARP